MNLFVKNTSLFLLYIIVFLIRIEANVVILESKAWGPGLKPHTITMQARYIFLSLTTSNNQDYTDDLISFKVTGSVTNSNRACRIWSNVLNRRDGTYILRYKLFEPCNTLQIDITHQNKHLAESPYKIDEVVYDEKTYCPKMQLSEWLNALKCGQVPNQIKSDLKLFDEINWNEIRTKLIQQYDSPHSVSLCHYVLKDNQVYRKCYGKHVGFKMFMDSILLSLTRKVYLPDLEFFVNLGDWPLVKGKTLYPIFSWCGSSESSDIVLPTYDITESTLENMGRVMLDMLSVQGNTPFVWANRIPKVFWRGRDSNMHRLNLIDIARDNPELFNATITRFFFFRDKMEKYGVNGADSQHVSFYEFFNYKYQINIDGTVAAYRFPYLLAGGSLVFKQQSKYYEHFYNDLIPNYHYIPLKTDLSDLITKLQWALQNDDKAKAIAENAKNFANKHLLPKDIYCYHGMLLNEFSKRLTSPVDVLPDMELVEQPNDVNYCDKNLLNKDEL